MTPAPMDPQRALTLSAFNALIDQTLPRGANLGIPSYAPRHLLERLQDSGLADVTSTADRLTMVMLGVRASSGDGTAHALLRNWQAAAIDAIITGARP